MSQESIRKYKSGLVDMMIWVSGMKSKDDFANGPSQSAFMHRHEATRE